MKLGYLFLSIFLFIIAVVYTILGYGDGNHQIRMGFSYGPPPRLLFGILLGVIGIVIFIVWDKKRVL